MINLLKKYSLLPFKTRTLSNGKKIKIYNNGNLKTVKMKTKEPIVLIIFKSITITFFIICVLIALYDLAIKILKHYQ
ncbi:hypothetical protein AVT43_gp79 [Polaribacter phage P12002L]|uniref:Uncharacterized protein n=2 Tax=Incheonvirus TaxID=2976977 RepID=A0A0F7IJS6_9CAUD|nr:hypothetical protein AVT42_gp81 [Polaribacter phage P12002S]YP_009209739.1 hypothetical protein AVT43_gp79 [Polaribacter phage P12002L]AKG94253.1 hypothetical protein P12002L_0079 [Polaribacter phage P12002L]AKG94337.1 hypothetical protein P12002S_0081 [Polaribacter phage P12002S]